MPAGCPAAAPRAWAKTVRFRTPVPQVTWRSTGRCLRMPRPPTGRRIVMHCEHCRYSAGPLNSPRSPPLRSDRPLAHIGHSQWASGIIGPACRVTASSGLAHIPSPATGSASGWLQLPRARLRRSRFRVAYSDQGTNESSQPELTPFPVHIPHRDVYTVLFGHMCASGEPLGAAGTRRLGWESRALCVPPM